MEVQTNCLASYICATKKLSGITVVPGNNALKSAPFSFSLNMVGPNILEKYDKSPRTSNGKRNERARSSFDQTSDLQRST